MRKLGWLALALLLAWPMAAWAGDGAGKEAAGMASRQRMGLEQRVGPEVYKEAGLAKLNPEEQAALARWLEDYTRQITAATEATCRRELERK